MGFTGQCRCGNVSLSLQAETLPPLYACHCLNCQRWSGSAFGLHLLCGAQGVQTAGALREYQYKHEGVTSTHYACDVCLTRLFNETTAAPDMRVVRASVLDGAAQWTPRAHIWTKRRQPWVVLPEDVAQWPESPTPQAFAQAMYP
ncbi:GFA family protein [Pseudomonas kermanshahensis]|uniref:GFA family protein n=1 Tax=Pseudomonas kermanshahensis TaxID=2745482 RepID=UPI0023DAD903|nr:GFA family protein [Pseudomonas kermanshahensis]WEL53502.1 GFA family protein [Pseudomonas kermanshahensis]